MNIAFENPYAFALLALYLAFAYFYKKGGADIRFPNVAFLGAQSRWNKVTLYKFAIVTLLTTALASPYLHDSKSAFDRNGKDIILALDASGSMGEVGFDEANPSLSKFDITKSIAKEFVTGRVSDNFGVVLFGDFAFITTPLTYEKTLLADFIANYELGIAGDSTALGDAIVQSLKALRTTRSKNRIIILLTDGKHNSGTTTLADAVKELTKSGVRVYTIALGKDYDKGVLEAMTKRSGGKNYEATNKQELSKCYEEIDSLESSAIKSPNYLNTIPLFYYPLTLAIALMMLFWHKRYKVFS